MADNDGDSRMASSPEPSDIEEIKTPANQTTVNPADINPLSTPPDSQYGHTSTVAGQMPTSAPGANANGKRPINTISNGDESEVLDLTGSGSGVSGGKQRGQDFPPKTHERSGYVWSRWEDEPGYAWLNKKAMDERSRALDGLVHQNSIVGNRYGDVFEMVEKEQAMINSMKQQ